ncbi:MAG: DsrE family protein [Marinobacter sp.]|uniref:DsrE family protein n=1 Tax=Marinobacter sp. TaxID=50741 RepID=UPI00299CF421|nr:DsrE family protein [Marinobacter sp.]MDX1634345.1 DsrE family protein [Marinobacter sp.]
MAVLMVIDRPPYGDWRGREALDMAFSLAAFDQPVALLFAGAGVNWLRPGQDGSALAQKTLGKQLQAAAIFGIEEILVEREALSRYHLSQGELLPAAEPVDLNAHLLARFGQVVQL